MSHDHKHHIKIYKRVWLTLFFLTYVTVHVAYFNFGVLNIAIAMLIATIKASLVILFFMHLKEDNRLNQVVFIAAFFFLAIFMGLTLSDTLFRPKEAAAKVTMIEVPAGQEASLHEKFREANEELLAHGKTVYLAQCQACHGAEGKGDGAAAGALKPPPRNFTAGLWTQGGTPSQVFKTVTSGIAGTGMSAFASLPVKDRWAAVHYVRSLSPNPPAETEETWTKSALATKSAEDISLPKLPIQMAMELLVQEAAKN